MEIKPIKMEADYSAAMRRIEAVWGTAQGTREGDELELLVTLVEAYERRHHPINITRRTAKRS
jgi:HTH-type transcriptional regulator/antitoxin HigA